VHFPAWWARYLNSVYAAGLAHISFSMPLLKLMATARALCGYSVYAADVLVRCGVDRDDFR
jgi:hypothetical protein